MRPASSLLLFAIVFIPLALKSRDTVFAFTRAVPMLLISVCAFIANDLDDIDADRINHPQRPLPSRRVSPRSAAFVYFICLAAALVTTKTLVPYGVAFFYYLTMSLTISYRYIVSFIPHIKAMYTAATISIPAIIVARYNGSARLYAVALALFAFSLGRELCMDVADRPGDEKSPLHLIKPNAIAVCAFVVQIASQLVIVRSLPRDSAGALVDVAVILLLMLLAAACWFRLKRYSLATDLMKLQLLLGLYFLVCE